MRILVVLFLITCSQAYGQDDLMLVRDTNTLDYEIKIIRISNDTLYYKAFRKNELFLLKDVRAYRFKDSTWVYPNPLDKQRYVIRSGYLLLRHLQVDITLKQYELPLSHRRRIKKLKKGYLSVTSSPKNTEVGELRPLALSVRSDTANSLFVLPVSRIASDTLFFEGNIGHKQRIYGIPVNQVSSFVDDYTATGPMMGLLQGYIGPIFINSAETFGQIIPGNMAFLKKKRIYLQQDNWKVIPRK